MASDGPGKRTTARKVRPRFQRRGLGRSLLRTVCGAVRAAGAKRFVLNATGMGEPFYTVGMFLTKEAVRLAMPGHAEAVACEGCPPLSRLFEQYAEGGGELLVCPICFNARKLAESDLAANARIAGATPMLEWIGDDNATVFSY